MAKINEIDITSLTFQEGAAPTTPGSTKWKQYFKTDGLYVKDDAGTETGPLGAAAASFSGARVYNSANVSCATGAWTSITFNSERFDTSSYHDTGSNTSRLTIPSNGYYLIGACIELAANATGTARFARFFLNNTTRIGEAGWGFTPASGNVIRFNLHTIYSLSASDYVEVQVFQDSGGALNAVANANSSPEFWIAKL